MTQQIYYDLQLRWKINGQVPNKYPGLVRTDLLASDAHAVGQDTRVSFHGCRSSCLCKYLSTNQCQQDWNKYLFYKKNNYSVAVRTRPHK